MKRLTQLLRDAKAHPFTGRFALGFAIHALITYGCAKLGLELPFILTIPIGIGSFAAADFALSGRDLQAARLRQSLAVVRKHRTALIRLAALFAITVLAFGDRQLPSEPFVQQVLKLVEIFGLFAVFWILAVSAMAATADGHFNNIGRMFSSFITGIAGYSAALWLIGTQGDAAYSWAIANPNEAAILAVAICVIWSIVKFTQTHSPVHALARKGEGLVAPGVAVFRLNPKQTERDLRYTATHEAGHALLYAALGELPADVKVSVNLQADDAGRLGFVTAPDSPHRLDEKCYSEWNMLVFLAGKAGEEFMFGESTLGAGSDHMRWLGIAQSYLANHYRGVFYVTPQNRLELEQNELKLEALQAEQREVLNQFFEANRDVYMELTEALLDKRTMGRDDLTPFLSRVHIPNGFPLSLGKSGEGAHAQAQG